jgi:hypothetical protein
VGGGWGLPSQPLQYHWPLEGMGPETHVHKITNVTVFYIWRLDLIILMHDFDAANPLLGSLEGVGPEISTFLCPNGTRFASCDLRAQSFNGHRNGYCSHQNQYVPRRINNRYIDSYFPSVQHILYTV